MANKKLTNKERGALLFLIGMLGVVVALFVLHLAAGITGLSFVLMLIGWHWYDKES